MERKITVKVVPNAKKNLVREEDGRLKVYLTAPARDGKANQALTRVLAEHFGVRKSAVQIAQGEKNRQKIVRILASFLFLACLAVIPASASQLPNRDVREFHLKNGLTVLYERVPAAEVVNLSLLVKTGSATEGDYAGTGITHLLEHLTFKGKLADRRLAAVVEKIGGYTNAFTSRDYTLFTATVPAAKWPAVLPTLLNSVFAPSFDEADFQKERQVVLREISRNEDEPGYQAGTTLWQTAFLTHPYRLPVSGYPPLLAGITWTDVRKYHDLSYTPINSVLAVAGPISAAEVEQTCLENAGDLPSGRPFLPNPPEEPGQNTFRSRTGYFETELSFLNFGWHIPALTHPDTPALDILSGILGEGRTSRLYRALVEKGLVFSADAGSYTPRYPGLFIVSAICRPEKTGEVEAIIRREVNGLLAGVTNAEIELSRKQLTSQLLYPLETVEGRTSDLAANYFLTGNPLYSRTYLETLDTITPAELKGVARKYLRGENLTVTRIYPKKQPAAGAETSPAAGAETAGRPEGIEEFRLRNNAALLVREEKGNLPIVTFSCFLKGGLLFENKENNGISSILAGLLTAGTDGRTAQDISRTIDSWGGRLEPFSGNNSYGLTLTVPSEKWRPAFALLAELAQKPSFPEDQVKIAKEQALGGIISRAESSFGRAEDALRRSIFNDHPYGLPPAGTQDSVKRIDRQALIDRHRQLLTGDNLVITAFGDLPTEAVRSEADKLFGSLPAEGVREPAPVRFGSSGPILKQISTAKKEAVVLIGFPGISARDLPENAVLDVAAEILNGQEGMLFQRLREDEPLVYSSGFSYFAGLRPGMLFFYGQCRPEKTGRVREIMADVIGKMREKPFSDTEIREARARVIGSRKISRQTLAGKAFETGLAELYGSGYDFPQKLEQAIESVAAADVRRFAVEFLTPEKQTTVVVSPDNR